MIEKSANGNFGENRNNICHLHERLRKASHFLTMVGAGGPYGTPSKSRCIDISKSCCSLEAILIIHPTASNTHVDMRS